MIRKRERYKEPESGVTTCFGQPQSYFQLDPRRHITSHQQTPSTERPLLRFHTKQQPRAPSELEVKEHEKGKRRKIENFFFFFLLPMIQLVGFTSTPQFSSSLTGDVHPQVFRTGTAR